jgi:chromosome segregation ATPase
MNGYELEEEEQYEEEFGEVDKLPDFASAQSKELHKETLKYKERTEKVNKDLDETKQRLGIMQEHLKNVVQEVKHTTDLVNAKKKEIETEDHLTQLVVREAGRYQQEFQRMTESNETGDDKLSMAQNNIFKGNERMDQFKLEMNWNQEELEQWALAAKQKEDDNLALQKYTRADEVKIKEINLLIEKVTRGVIDAKTKLENEATETQARQIELDRTAEEFRSVHAERQTLVRQWQDTIEAMRRRDQTIQDLATQYAEERRKHAEQVDNLQQQREHLKGLVDDNDDVESKTALIERVVQKRREELMNSQAKLQEFVDELDVLKNELASGATALMRKRNENATATKALEDKKASLVEARKKYQLAKKALDDEVKATARTELSAKEAELKLKDEDAALKKQEFLLQQMKDNMFRQSQSLFQLRQEEANMISEISGAQSSSRNLQVKVRQLDQESIRQQELIYNAEFQIQQMERKVSRGLGERSDEETKKLKQEIVVCEEVLEKAKEQKRMLVSQCRKLNFELRAAVRKKEMSVKAQADLEAQINQLEIENMSESQTLEALVKQKEDAMVQNDVMRLELKRLRDTLNSRADKVFSLENRKQQLALSMEERKHEIAVHQEVQRAQLRAADEERHRITIELGGRRQAVEKLRNKFETLCKVSGVRGDDEGGEQKSQAYYMIQAAQKREELQRQGDEMDQDIRKNEKEIRALTHTLKHLATQNTDFRSAHQRVDMTGDDAEKLKLLEEQTKVAQDALFKRKKELQRLQTDFEEDSRRLEQVMQQAARLEERNRHLENAKQQMDSELEVQRENVDKVTRRVIRMSGVHREKQGVDAMEETLQEKEFRAEATLDTVQNALFTLGQLAKEYPEIKDVLAVSLQEIDMSIPARPATRAGGGGVAAGGDDDARSELSSHSGPLRLD